MIKKIFSNNTKEDIDNFINNKQDIYLIGIDLAKKDSKDYSCLCYTKCEENGDFVLEKSQLFKGEGV